MHITCHLIRPPVMPANTSISAPGRRRSGSQDMSNHWLQYRKRRDHSLLRMQLVNTLFLLIMIYSSAFIGDAQVIGHIGTNIALWLIPAGIIAAFLAIDITSPALSSMFSLDQLTSWTRIGQFLILIRMYRVMLMLMDELHMHSHYGGLCHGMPFGPMELAMTTIIDVVEAYVWSAFNFPAPWAATLFSVEALGMTIRLLSCQTLLHEYLLHSGYAIGAAISYYAMLYLYHYLMNGFYAQSFVEVARVRRLIGIRTKYLDSMNRSVKLALQYVSGCIQKFETTRVTALAANADKAMLSTLRNVQHITFITDDIVILSKLEDGPLGGGSSGSVDMLSVLRELITGLQDPFVPVFKSFSPNININDIQTRAPVLRCSSAMLNSIVSNVALYALTAIRRRALRQRVGYNAYLNVVGFILEQKSAREESHRNSLLQVLSGIPGKAILPSKSPRLVLRLVFDHNGDTGHVAMEKAPSLRKRARSFFKGLKVLNRESDYADKAPNFSGDMMDGTEIFQVQLKAGDRPSHNFVNKGPIYDARLVPVRNCADIYSVNDDQMNVSDLSPLTLATIDSVLKSCNGHFEVLQFVVGQDDDGSLRSAAFNRLVIDIPCDERPKDILIKKRRSTVASDVLPMTSTIKLCLVISEKELLWSLCTLLQDLKIAGDAIRLKRNNFSKDQVDVASFLKNKYTAVFFDVESVGGQLREMGYVGDRVFFSPDSIALESSSAHTNYDHVLPIPCPVWAMQQYISVKKASRSVSTFTSQTVIAADAEGVRFDNNHRHRNDDVWLHGAAQHFSNLFRLVSRLFAVVFKAASLIFGSTYRFVYWMVLEPASGSQIGVPSFGAQFNFRAGANFIPLFNKDIEYKFMSWRVYNIDKGFLSHGSTFILGVTLITVVHVLAELYRLRSIGSYDSLNSLLPMLAICISIFVFLLNLFVTPKIVKSSTSRYYLMFVLAVLALMLNSFTVFHFLNTSKSDADLRITPSSWAGANSFSLIFLQPHKLVLFPFILVFWRISTLFVMFYFVRTWTFFLLIHRAGYMSLVLIRPLMVVVVFWLIITLFRIFELELFRRVEYQTLSWHRFRAAFLQSCRHLSWVEMRYPLKTILKQRRSLLRDIGDILVDRDHSFLTADIFENARALNFGLLQLEKLSSVHSFMDLYETEQNIELNNDVFLLKEEVAYIAHVLGLKASRLNAEISIMVDPVLAIVIFDRQIFRMLLTNAILMALENLEAVNIAPSDGDTAPTMRCIREVLVQIGVSPESLDSRSSEHDKMFYDFNYNFLRSKCGCPKGIGTVMTIAVIDNGVPCDLQHESVDGEIELNREHYRTIIVKLLKGLFEQEVLYPPNLFRNITRYIVPYSEVGPSPSIHCDLKGSCVPQCELWLAPCCCGYSGFERASDRYEHMRLIYSKRKSLAQYHRDILSSKRIDDEYSTNWDRKMIFVHPDVATGDILFNNFAMYGWQGTVMSSLDAVLHSPNLHTADLIMICTSILYNTDDKEFIPIAILNGLGFFGAVMCLEDGYPLPECSVNDVYTRLSIPILGSTVSAANEAADRALLDYIIGTNRCDGF